MREFTTSIDIAAPRERVWQVMSDTDRWCEWTASVTSAKRLGNAPFAVGTKVLVRQPKFPPALWTVTAIEPDSSFTWVSSAPGFRAEMSTSLHAASSAPLGAAATLSQLI